jgi:hypothetical protein
MGAFIVGSAALLVLLQATLLLMDREQTSWTFSLVQKSRNSTAAPSLDQLRCLSRQPQNSTAITTDHHCYLWYHTAQQLDPVLTQWNPHLILLAIACVHCVIALYAARKPDAVAGGTPPSGQTKSFLVRPLYVSGSKRTCSCAHFEDATHTPAPVIQARSFCSGCVSHSS